MARMEVVPGIRTRCKATIYDQRRVIEMSKTQKNYPVIFKAKVAVAGFQEEAPISELAFKYWVYVPVRLKNEAIIIIRP